jgi:hypothetical protein
MRVPTKSILASKGVWLGVLVALLPVLESVLGLLEAIGVEWPVVVSIIGGAIIGLRWITKQPVSLLGGDEKEVDVA